MERSVRLGTVLFGKYQIEQELGKGGMGMVVAARHLGLGELFAIKFLLPTALSNHDAVERFVREARAAARLKGEHVARVHDVGQLEDGTPYMVMEYLRGCDLAALLKRMGRLPPAEAIVYLLQAAEAVAEAHTAGIVHRDLKPANLFLTHRPNGTPCVKVLDFGISKMAEADEEGGALTQTGMLLGSPRYMAPEQMVPSKGIDARVDVWALGVCLYELLTGVSPFKASTHTEIVARVLADEPPRPSSAVPGLPPVFDEIIERCLKKRPEERMRSVNDLSIALRSVEMALFGLPAGNVRMTASMMGVAGVVRGSIVDEPSERTVEEKTREMAAVPPSRIPQRSTPLQATIGIPGPELPPVPEVGRETGATNASWGNTAATRRSAARGKMALVAGAVATLVLGLGTVGFVVTRPAPAAAPAAASSAIAIASPHAAPMTTPAMAEPPATAPEAARVVSSSSTSTPVVVERPNAAKPRTTTPSPVAAQRPEPPKPVATTAPVASQPSRRSYR